MHFSSLSRLKEILTVFLEEEFGYFIKKAELHHYIPFAKRWKHALQSKKPWKGEVHLRQAFERLGPTFIKFGQLLSLRPDLLPPAYITELEKMQDHAPPVPYPEIRRVIQDEFGKKPEEVFSKIDHQPIATASLAQVHRAWLKNGTLVALKVQRPNVERIIRAEIEVLMFLAHWMEKRHAARGLPLVALVEEFKRWTMRELNFHFEASNTRIIGENFKGSDIIVPEVYDEFSTQRVLALEFITGTPISDVSTLKKRKDLPRLIKRVYSALVEMVIIHGIFHADPHPGNILVHGKKIAFIDFGVVGRFDDRLRKITLELLTAAVRNDSERAMRAILELQQDDNFKDKDALMHDLRDILDQIRLEKLQNIHVSQLMASILETINRHSIHVPLDFTLYAKTLITIEGMGLRYSPDLCLLKQTAPILEKEMTLRYSPKAVLRGAKSHLDTYQEILEKTPEYFLEAAKKASTGKWGIEIAPQEFSDLRVELEHSSGNIAIGLMIAAITVSAALIMQIPSAPTILGMHYVAFYGFAVAAVLGAWLVHRTMFVKTIKA